MTPTSAAEGSTADEAGSDLAPIRQAFFEEAGDNLSRLEEALLTLDPAAVADEPLHAIFRCAHSVKGGAAALGFEEVTTLTHAMETLLDRLRRHEQDVTSAMVDTLLEAGDLVRAMLACHQGAGCEPPDAAALLERLRAHVRAAEAPPAAASAPGERDLELFAGPLDDLSEAEDLLELFGEVAGAGKLERAEPLPQQPARTVRFRLRTTATDGEVRDLCSLHVLPARIRLGPWPAPAKPATAEPAPPAAIAPPGAANAPQLASETLRVSLDKVDQLINLMGELVITQAMLSQRVAALEAGARQQLDGGIADLERTTRDLQESVMAIRMIPMSEVFQRFPRMLRDLAGRLGKQVELRTVGGATELDKGMIEKVTDPLTHLVRNAVDHGIESPGERVAAGKPAAGTLTLAARHEGGCIVVEVSDDGRGLDRERILAKARLSGMVLPDGVPDSEVWQLIFAPGFSTAEVVTEVSGRGVGMDVVRRNILSLGGSVELLSGTGRGTCVRVRLPLTLAIMDAITVAVGGEHYVLPLGNVLESFQAPAHALRRLPNGARVVQVREDYVPVLPLDAFVGRPLPPHDGPTMMVLVHSESRRVALQVGEIVGQQQVVVKNLEANYGRVPGIAAATIMADGSVALILDVAALVQGAAAPSSPGLPGRQQGGGRSAADDLALRLAA